MSFVPVMLIRRVPDDSGGKDKDVQHFTVGGEVIEQARGSDVNIDGELHNRQMVLRVHNTPLIRSLPRDVDVLQVAGDSLRWRIQRIEAKPTSVFATIFCGTTG